MSNWGVKEIVGIQKGRTKEIWGWPIGRGGGGRKMTPYHFPKSLGLPSINNDGPLNDN